MSRTIGAALAVGASVAMLVVSTTTAEAAQATSHATAEESSFVQLQVEHSGKCLAIANGSLQTGSYAVQSTCDESVDHQLFELRPASSGTFELRAKHSGSCLSSNSTNLFVGQRWCFDDSTQRWKVRLVEVTKELYQLRSVEAPQYCLAIDFDKPQDDGTPAMLWDCHDAASQRWRIRPVAS
ncbi:RICIN domain-containing protein [Streptomyces cinnamoneus]|uniref:RICIN domain-containing protein n=1 Tax=Streptomyces cinnamoneus TaxID=53446 RepID=UPI0033F39479